jgi:hypothetical protein
MHTWHHFVTAIVFTTAVLPAASAAADEKFRIDPWGIELTDFCDFRDGAPISDKCYGFVAGVAESMLGEQVGGPQLRFCPKHFDVPKMIAKIRPGLREHYGFCAGFCTSESYVATELYRAYPCPPSKS